MYPPFPPRHPFTFSTERSQPNVLTCRCTVNAREGGGASFGGGGVCSNAILCNPKRLAYKGGGAVGLTPVHTMIQ
jgi:hypothetical protein